MNTAIARYSLPSIVFLAAFAVLPTFASAATSQISTQTTQLLPTGAQTCPAITVSSVTPYVYGGDLGSFNVVISDPAYVAIGGSVGNTVLPFNYFTRWMGAGALTIHADTDPMPIGAGLPVSVTFLSAVGGITCATTVSFTVLPDASYPATITPVGGSTGSGAGTQGGSNGGGNAPEQPAPTTSGSTSTPPSAVGTFCEGRGALWLWLNLILAYVILAAIAALSRTPMVQKNPAIPVAMILVPLILLVGFWYFSSGCRVGNWVPLVLLVIAIVALLVAFRDQKGGPLMLLATPPKPIPMPPAKPASSAKAPEKPAETKAPAAAPKTAQKGSAPAANPHVQKILEKLMKLQEENKNKL